MNSSPSYNAGGDISPSRFVKLSTTADNTVIQAVADDEAIGVSHQGSLDAPIPGVTPLAARENQPCQVFGADEPCEIEAGGAIASGDKLKPDADGKAVVAGAGDAYSAIARSAAAAGESVAATVTRGIIPAA